MGGKRVGGKEGGRGWEGRREGGMGIAHCCSLQPCWSHPLLLPKLPLLDVQTVLYVINLQLLPNLLIVQLREGREEGKWGGGRWGGGR